MRASLDTFDPLDEVIVVGDVLENLVCEFLRDAVRAYAVIYAWVSVFGNHNAGPRRTWSSPKKDFFFVIF